MIFGWFITIEMQYYLLHIFQHYNKSLIYSFLCVASFVDVSATRGSDYTVKKFDKGKIIDGIQDILEFFGIPSNYFWNSLKICTQFHWNSSGIPGRLMEFWNFVPNRTWNNSDRNPIGKSIGIPLENVPKFRVHNLTP